MFLVMASNPIYIRWIRTGSQPYYPHNIRGKLSIILRQIEAEFKGLRTSNEQSVKVSPNPDTYPLV